MSGFNWSLPKCHLEISRVGSKIWVYSANPHGNDDSAVGGFITVFQPNPTFLGVQPTKNLDALQSNADSTDFKLIWNWVYIQLTKVGFKKWFKPMQMWIRAFKLRFLSDNYWCLNQRKWGIAEFFWDHTNTRLVSDCSSKMNMNKNIPHFTRNNWEYTCLMFLCPPKLEVYCWV